MDEFGLGRFAQHFKRNYLSRVNLYPMVILVITSLLIRLYLIGFHDVISADGIGYVGAARRLSSGDMSSLANNGFYVFLTWCFGLFTPDFETSGKLVSAISGSLLVVPLYLLGTRLFNRSTALAACIATVAWPSLLGWSCEVMTQATYTTLALTGCYLVWRMFQDESVLFGFWAGISIGLAYLTRTEAALLFLVLPLFPMWMRHRDILRMKRAILVYACSFIFLCGTHIIMLRITTGAWQLSAKTSFALNDALSYYLERPDLNYIPGIEQAGYFDIITRFPGFIWTNSIRNLALAWETIVPLPLWILALLGFCANGFGKSVNFQRLFLLSTFSPLVVIIVFYYIGPEYTQPYLPVLFLWCAEGLRTTEYRLTSRLVSNRQPIFDKTVHIAPFTIAAVFIYCTVLLISQIPKKYDLSNYSCTDDGARRDHKRIGLLLKSNLPPGKIMTRSGRIAYYADREWMMIPNTDANGILQAAVDGGVRFLVLDGTLFDTRPQLEELLRPLGNQGYPDKFLYVSRNNKNSFGANVLIYRDPSSVGVVVREIIPQ